MTVDVLFPYYGDVAMMKLAVESVLRQSYSDFRLIVVDDGYPDDSIPGWFAGLNDDRVSYERNEKNLGANGNYRKCLAMATNELCVVMGADDIMMPNYLEWLTNAAAEHPEADIFQPGVFVIDEFGAPSNTLVEKIKGVYRPKGRGVKILKGQEAAANLIAADWLYFPSLGWRTETMKKYNFREGYNVVQDLCLVLDIIMGGGALLLDDVAAFEYRRHSGSDSSWRALEGTRFDEERAFFGQMAKEFSALGWTKAALRARTHMTSRFHAASLLPKAALKQKWTGCRNLGRHLVK